MFPVSSFAQYKEYVFLSPNVASKQQTDFFHIKPVLLEINDQFLRLRFPCMAFPLSNAFWDVSSFISYEENIQEFLVRRKQPEVRRGE